jgi:hypothetical protein
VATDTATYRRISTNVVEPQAAICLSVCYSLSPCCYSLTPVPEKTPRGSLPSGFLFACPAAKTGQVLVSIQASSELILLASIGHPGQKTKLSKFKTILALRTHSLH